MKRILFFTVALAVAFVCRPNTLSAQLGGCSANCAAIRDQAGNVVGFGCINAPGANTSCIATALRCSTQECKNVLLTDAQGQLLALADTCQDELVIRPVPTVSVVPRVAAISLQPAHSSVKAAAEAFLPSMPVGSF